jgi:hypothetical protein
MSNAEIRGLFVWHELMTTDPQSAATFYTGVFRWSVQSSGVPGYTLWMSGETGVSGLMAQPEEARLCGTPPSWLVYLGTADVDATVHAAQRLGGKVLKDPADIPSIGRFAVLADPQGAVFAVFTPAVPAPEDAATSRVISQFSWHELATSDPQGALDFYSSLFGWGQGAGHDMGGGNVYHIIEREDAKIGGIYRLQDPSRPPHWLAYVKVDDLDGTVAAARAAGGQIVHEPHEVPGGDRVARILDPQGGVIAVHEVRQAIGTPARKPRRPVRKAARQSPARQSPARQPSQRPTAKRPSVRAAGSRAAPRRSKPKVKSASAEAPARKSAPRRSTAQAPARKGGPRRSSAQAPPARKSAPRRSSAQAPARKSVRPKHAVRAGSLGKATRKRQAARRR